MAKSNAQRQREYRARKRKAKLAAVPSPHCPARCGGSWPGRRVVSVEKAPAGPRVVEPAAVIPPRQVNRPRIP